MPLVLIGLFLFIAKMAEFGPMADWSWWIILAPFGLAVLWWQFADSSGWTKRREMDKMEERKRKRRDQAMDALGLNTDRDRKLQQARTDAVKRAAKSAASK